ncbi:hypothetical protein kac65v162_gp002 [Nodularia phage vB_NspS-kac65v162]|uniref:Uncharacterized protein n=3 Tax=Ravarandavirus kac65v151 TaxID=2845689 RepID=A0A482MJ72_9CAUD|nr:hypothetical protein HWC12_gp002 [Nodularia phage vB_NspS-kac65v151]QBQ73034.1 hypothetical protein kac65v151_gp002 [Nodularia phage vB_NspS-kac65v151]QBQ73240.1 hypothetical protein kac65v161_gp002 [Nodularia phage vB_NspS-kac65v161]QBQ73446.1 hypothetical protein kac65v162_gp002 [Nodularia phage vB_NspS-kac65v162]
MLEAVLGSVIDLTSNPDATCLVTKRFKLRLFECWMQYTTLTVGRGFRAINQQLPQTSRLNRKDPLEKVWGLIPFPVYNGWGQE